MSFTKPIKVEQTKTKLVFKYGGESIIWVKRSALKQLASDLGVDGELVAEKVTKKKVTRKKKKVKSETSSVETKALQLSRSYRKHKAKFHGIPIGKMKLISPDSPKFKHFIEAAEMIQGLGLKNLNHFFQAQIEGLSFVNNGKGRFPEVNQLATEASQTRVLNWMQDNGMLKGKRKETIKVVLSRDDMELPLADNPKYMHNRGLVKEGLADKKQTKYVMEVQQYHNGKVHDYVKDYWEKLGG